MAEAMKGKIGSFLTAPITPEKLIKALDVVAEIEAKHPKDKDIHNVRMLGIRICMHLAGERKDPKYVARLTGESTMP